jgi:phosphosulfolactate synthase
MADNQFLDLPPRTAKPRRAGLTQVIDSGLPVDAVASLLASIAPYVDVWRLGYGTAYLDPTAADKVALLARHEVNACLGGTLLEVAWLQGKADRCLDWAAGVGFPWVEVSNGAAGMPTPAKRRLIAAAAERFTVVAEVGSKDPAAAVSGAAWAAEMAGDLRAGAAYAVAEGRESGTVGVYTPDGAVRQDVVEAVADTVGGDLVLFEAPQKHQQAWFICRFGSDVGLANVAPAAVLGLEALRLGLRADTIGLARARQAATALGGP